VLFSDCGWVNVNLQQLKSRWCPYRSIGSPSRPWRHSVGLRPATTAANWCRSPTAAPASSPSPAWSHCHSQSSSLKSPPRNGPHHMGLHSGYDAWGKDRQGKMMEAADIQHVCIFYNPPLICRFLLRFLNFNKIALICTLRKTPEAFLRTFGCLWAAH